MTTCLFSSCAAGQLKWKENLLEKASDAFLRRQKETPNLRKLVYGNGEPKSLDVEFHMQLLTSQIIFF